MNAAVLVSNVVNRKKTWKEAAEVLVHFWTDGSKEEENQDEKKGGLPYTPDFSKWLLDEKTKKPKIFNASPEAVRKYYSVKQYFLLEHQIFFILKDQLRLTPDPKIWRLR
jgi:hypothetical protein